MKNLGMNPNEQELESIIDDVDQMGNGEISFDDFCDVMKRVNAKKRTWNEVVRECFHVFDRVSVILLYHNNDEFRVKQEIYRKEIFDMFCVNSEI